MLRLLLLFLFVLGSACGGYSYVSTVHRDPGGGTLAVRSNESSWEEAQRRMSNHCAGSYSIVDERRVVIGQETTTEATEQGDRVITRDLYERQVTYICASPHTRPQSGATAPPTSSGSRG